jgi:uncharacterized membrane protein YgaE (UPF0421/DUF939 family)
LNQADQESAGLNHQIIKGDAEKFLHDKLQQTKLEFISKSSQQNLVQEDQIFENCITRTKKKNNNNNSFSSQNIIWVMSKNCKLRILLLHLKIGL